MSDTIMYHEGSRRLQDEFESRRIADRLEAKLTRRALTADDKILSRVLSISFWQPRMQKADRIVLSKVACRVSSV